MLQSETGRTILTEKPLISGSILSNYDKSMTGSFGNAYNDFMSLNKISADTRASTVAPVSLETTFSSLPDPESRDLQYLMVRYRQIHDFVHVLLGLGIDLRSEICLKWFESFHFSGLPLSLMGSLVGPLRLLVNDQNSFHKLISNDISWAIFQARSCRKLLLTLPWESMLDMDLEEIRRDLGVTSFLSSI